MQDNKYTSKKRLYLSFFCFSLSCWNGFCDKVATPPSENSRAESSEKTKTSVPASNIFRNSDNSANFSKSSLSQNQNLQSLKKSKSLKDFKKKHDPRFIRDVLFKSKQPTQMHEENQAHHTNLLRNINLRKADSRTIPPIALSSFSVGHSSSKANREMFLKFIIAAIKCVNQMIVEHRSLVRLVKERGLANLSEEQAEQFRMICSFYQTSSVNELLKRVAPVPVSLAAAQASLECGFGSVKFMSTRNAYFGMMKNQTELQSFDTVFQAAIAYAKTLNVHGYYRTFREERLKMLENSQKIDGMKLCAFIAKYCVRKEYRQRVTTLIKEYKLTEFDQIFESA